MKPMTSIRMLGVAALFIVAALWQPFAARSPQDPGILATRLPLVMVGGQVSQLPAGDILNAPDGASLGATTFTNGFSSLSGQAVLGANGLQVNTFSGAAATPKIRAFAGDPNGTVTADVGSLVLDTVTPGLWFNTDGASAWSAFSTSSAITGLNYGWFGSGIDGSPTFDGVTTILGMVPVANTYTLPRDLFLDSPICQSGVTFKTTGYAITVKTDFIGPASGTCTIRDDGTAGSNAVAGVGRLNGAAEGGPGRFRGGKNGGAGGCNNAFGGAGNASAATANGPSPGYVTGNGGADGVPNAGAGATSVVESVVNGSIGSVVYALAGNGGNGSPPTSTNWAGGSGGGGGGSNGLGLGCGGGGGGGGGYTFLVTRHVTNPGHVLVSANGGAGGNASGQSGGNSSGGGGGGGGGYSIVLLGFGTPPSQQASGGTFGAGAGGAGGPGVAGTNGQPILFKAGS